jgi:hypothetical protein
VKTEAFKEVWPGVSPTVFRYGGLRFFFFSREEERMHIHVGCSEGEAKIWIEPIVEVAKGGGLSRATLEMAVRLTKERLDEIRSAWDEHFGS